MTKGDLTRQRILEKAAPIFNQRGYAGASMQEIMEAAGLEKGGVYRHFASKEELAAEVFTYSLGQSVRLRMGDLKQIEGAIAMLRYMVRRFVEAPSAIAGGCPLMNTAIDADDGNPVLRKLAASGLKRWKNGICRIVQAGIRDGEVKPTMEPQQLANTIIATLEGALMISRMEGKRDALRDAQASLEVLLAHAARQ
jgi:TetR/AcrR family transcriptional repressor of nem operon